MTNKQRAQWFEDKLLKDYYEWRSKLPKGDRRGARYKGLITRLGGVAAMKQLLKSASNARKRWVFGAEHFVTLPEFRPLFSKEEVAEAKRRMKERKSS